MGIVSDHLIGLVAKQVAEHRLVVWYDPGAVYRAVVDRLNLPGTTVARYDGSFFKLRHEIDPLLEGQEPPKLVVYVPLDQGATEHALVELDKAGVVMQPGQQPANRNTRLAVVARNALKAVIGETNAAEIERQVDGGKLTLADVDELGKKGQEITKGIVSIVFGTGNTHDVAIAFLTDTKYDAEIEKKGAVAELAALLGGAFEAEFNTGALPDLRDRLARHILMSDLVVGLGTAVPTALKSVTVAASADAIAACRGLARTWRLRRDLRESYVAAAKKAEQDFSLDKYEFAPATAREIETFRAVERGLLRHVEKSLLDGPANEGLLALARSRLAAFWAEAEPTIQAHWALVSAICELLLEADRVEKEIKKAPATVAAFVHAYTDSNAPWCLLDSHHRHMASRWFNFDPGHEDGLEKLVGKAGRRYAEVGSELARRFVGLYQKAKHPDAGLPRQVDVFEKRVRPLLSKGKTAYVWVDALRYEMARELSEVLKDDFDLTLGPAIATVPTITEIGMASLVPKADGSAKVVAVGNGKLGLEVAGTVLKDRKDRVAFVKAHAGVTVADAKLDDLLPKPPPKMRTAIQGANLVLVTSQEIDEFGEQDTKLTRMLMDGMLDQLRRCLRTLRDQGVQTIIVVADHGHLVAGDVGDDMKIDPPGGKQADLHRRVWVGEGGNTDTAYMRTKLSALGVESELDIATPWNFAVFKVPGGNTAYFHGGLSPQELIVPVMTLTAKAGRAVGAATGVKWTLQTGAKKITTRFFSVQVVGTIDSLHVELPKVRVELRAKGKPVSRPVSASYGFEEATGDVAMKLSDADADRIETNTVTLMVTMDEDAPPKTVGLYLVDSSTGAELASLDKIENAISL